MNVIHHESRSRGCGEANQGLSCLVNLVASRVDGNGGLDGGMPPAAASADEDTEGESRLGYCGGVQITELGRDKDAREAGERCAGLKDDVLAFLGITGEALDSTEVAKVAPTLFL